MRYNLHASAEEQTMRVTAHPKTSHFSFPVQSIYKGPRALKCRHQPFSLALRLRRMTEWHFLLVKDALQVRSWKKREDTETRVRLMSKQFPSLSDLMRITEDVCVCCEAVEHLLRTTKYEMSSDNIIFQKFTSCALRSHPARCICFAIRNTVSKRSLWYCKIVNMQDRLLCSF